jgi:hypothetical protein
MRAIEQALRCVQRSAAIKMVYGLIMVGCAFASGIHLLLTLK